MGRRTSSGRIGAPTFGGLLADAETIRSDDNKDIIFDPTGTGIVKSEGHFQIQNQNSLRLGDADDSNYVAFQAPTTVNSNITWTLPAADGTAGYVLTTDGSGTLSWTQKSISVAENNTDSNQNFLYYNTTNTGNVSQLRFAENSRPLTYQPSTGTLNCVNATFTGTMTANQITETSSIAYKENFRTIDNALEKVLELTPKIYDRKDGSRKDEVGLVAEEVDKILPALVIKNNIGEPESVCYTRLGVYLIQCVKQIKEELDNIREFVKKG